MLKYMKTIPNHSHTPLDPTMVVVVDDTRTKCATHSVTHSECLFWRVECVVAADHKDLRRRCSTPALVAGLHGAQCKDGMRRDVIGHTIVVPAVASVDEEDTHSKSI